MRIPAEIDHSAIGCRPFFPKAPFIFSIHGARGTPLLLHERFFGLTVFLKSYYTTRNLSGLSGLSGLRVKSLLITGR